MSIYTKSVSFPNINQLYPLMILHVQCSLCVNVCLFTQKGVSFPNINQLHPLMILHGVHCRGANATRCRCYMETLPAILVHCEMEFSAQRDIGEAILCLLWCQPEQVAEGTLGEQVNWCGLTHICRYCDSKWNCYRWFTGGMKCTPPQNWDQS